MEYRYDKLPRKRFDSLPAGVGGACAKLVARVLHAAVPLLIAGCMPSLTPPPSQQELAGGSEDVVDDGPAETGATCLVAASCDDGDPCTTDDEWSSGCTCAGTPYDCDDGSWCTLDLCDGAGGCQHSTVEDACLIEGTCYAGEERHPSAQCRACMPSVATDGWTDADGAACDLDVPCFKGICEAGSCEPAGVTCGPDDCIDGLVFYELLSSVIRGIRFDPLAASELGIAPGYYGVAEARGVFGETSGQALALELEQCYQVWVSPDEEHESNMPESCTEWAFSIFLEEYYGAEGRWATVADYYGHILSFQITFHEDCFEASASIDGVAVEMVLQSATTGALYTCGLTEDAPFTLPCPQ